MKNTLVTACRRIVLLLVAFAGLSMSLLVVPSAFAATVPVSAHSAAQVRPLASGGGCNPAYYISSCISVNSVNTIVPDAYANGSLLCRVDVQLYEDGKFLNNFYYSNCYNSGTHFSGPQEYSAASGHFWFTETCAYVSNLSGNYCVGSYIQYT